MINKGASASKEGLKVFSGLDLYGQMNVESAAVRQNISHAIRLGYPQLQPQPSRPERVCIVGGGPSLRDTEAELRELLFDGAFIVATNGSYRWLVERNIRPHAMVLLDARAGQAHFFDPDVPNCRYWLCSQCHPDSWAAVHGRRYVGVFHSMTEDEETLRLLDEYYLGQWYGVPGGTSVGLRSIVLFRMLGFLRFDLFGLDSCWTGDAHHAFVQPENDAERRYKVVVTAEREPYETRIFFCAPWHLKQAEDFLQMIKYSGDQFLLNVHGDGLLAYLLQAQAHVQEVADASGHVLVGTS